MPKKSKSSNSPKTDLLDQMLSANDPTPFLQPVDLLPLKNDLIKVIHKYVVLDPCYAVALALWIIQTYCYQLFSHAPLLIINAPERACGKSVLLTLLARLVPRSLECANITVAALFRVVQNREPTILIDEADTFLDGKPELAGILNKGYEKGGVVLRVESIGDNFQEVAYQVYGPKALAGIALNLRLPDATWSRGIPIEMRRKVKGESVTRIRSAQPQEFADLRSRISRFVKDHKDQLIAGYEPMPEELSDREQDNWAPLFAIANCGGAEAVTMARDAALSVKGAAQEPQSVSNNLLADIREVLDGDKKPYIPSADLLELLMKDPEMGWSGYNRGFPLTARQLAKNLGGYGIRSKTVRMGAQTPKGYEIREFDEVFKRYLPVRDAALESVLEETPAELATDPLDLLLPPYCPRIEATDGVF